MTSQLRNMGMGKKGKIMENTNYSRKEIETNKSNILEETIMNNQNNAQQAQENTAKFFNKHSYGKIENKVFLACTAKTAYAIGQKAKEQGVVFSSKFDGDKSSVVVDGKKDKAFVDAVKKEFKVHIDGEPTFYNRKAYKDIENKAFINTDAKTAYVIGQKAKEQGVVFSAKFDGDKSTVTVDGKKDKAFVDAVKKEFNIIDKLNEIADVADKIEDAIDNGVLDKAEQSQER